MPDEVTAIYTKGHVLRITCPTQPKKELYQRSINVSVEPAATPVSAAPASSSQNARLNGSSQARPTVASTGAPVTVTRQPRSVPSKPPDPARETQRPSAKSPPAHDRSAEHRPDKNRKDYVRAPPRARECTGRYCRRNWHGTPHFTGKNPRDEKKPRDQEDDVVFVADEARSNAVNEGVPSVTEILEREGELNVEEYIRALEVDFAHIKNAV